VLVDRSQFHTDDEFISPYKFNVAGKNFGSGSSQLPQG
jgi:hypothetical protein